VVVTEVDVGAGAGGTISRVVVCSVVVRVVSVGPQELTSPTDPNSRPASNSRRQDFVLNVDFVLIIVLSHSCGRRVRGAHPIGPIVHWSVVVVVFVFDVVTALGGYVVVLVTLSSATPLLFR